MKKTSKIIVAHRYLVFYGEEITQDIRWEKKSNFRKNILPWNGKSQLRREKIILVWNVGKKKIVALKVK